MARSPRSIDVLFFCVVAVCLVLVGWWFWADRRLRSLPRSGIWRTLLGLFVGIQLAYLIFFFTVPTEARRAHLYVPEASLGEDCHQVGLECGHHAIRKHKLRAPRGCLTGIDGDFTGDLT